jgi:energy-coupling factor transport system permease protein
LSGAAFGILRTGYVSGRSVVHRLDGRTKFLFFLWISLFNYIFYDVWFSLASLILVVAMAFSARIQKFCLGAVLVVVVPIFIMGVLIIGTPLGFPYNETPLFITQILGVKVGLYLEGTAYVSVWTTRLAVTIIAALLTYLTTHPSDLATILLKSRVPYKFTYAFLSAIQLIPILTNEVSTIYQAQVSRGLGIPQALGERVKKLGFLLKSFAVLVVPLTLGAMHQSQVRAIALESRGFSAPVRKVMLHDPRFGVLDYLAIVAMFALTVVFIYLILTRGLVPFMQGVRYIRPGG